MGEGRIPGTRTSSRPGLVRALIDPIPMKRSWSTLSDTERIDPVPHSDVGQAGVVAAGMDFVQTTSNKPEQGRRAFPARTASGLRSACWGTHRREGVAAVVGVVGSGPRRSCGEPQRYPGRSGAILGHAWVVQHGRVRHAPSCPSAFRFLDKGVEHAVRRGKRTTSRHRCVAVAHHIVSVESLVCDLGFSGSDGHMNPATTRVASGHPPETRCSGSAGRRCCREPPDPRTENHGTRTAGSCWCRRRLPWPRLTRRWSRREDAVGF